MLFSSREFQIMEQSVDALWQKQKIVQQNIANYDTPDYKAKTLSFREVLNGEKGVSDDRRIVIDVATDDASTVRPDGNNVDMVKENLELYKTYLQSAYLYDKISGKFKGIRDVISQMPR